jgi:hypothetical protein
VDGYGYVNDDDDEIAPDAKVSFFSVLWSPPGKMFENDNSGGRLRCPAPCLRLKLNHAPEQDLYMQPSEFSPVHKKIQG